MKSSERLIVALDVPTIGEAAGLAERIGDAAGCYKIGLELYSAAGPAAVHAIGAPVFLDLKLHDIPTTVARAVRAIAPLGAAYLTVHATGGRAMLEAAAEAKGTQKVLAVTILTHLDDTALKEIGLPPAAEAVPALARLAAESGCDGAVCAPADLEALRRTVPEGFLLVTPGVRPKGSDADEHARALTPAEAIARGADRLVVGRPVTRAPDPRAAAGAILAEL